MRCASQRGYVILLGSSLVRLTETNDGWQAVRLTVPSTRALNAMHEHAVRVVTLCDGWDVLVCEACGTEW